MVPLTTGDELGELAASFNEMVEGLAERERLREVFGTYLDKEIAEYILSEGFAEEGEEVEVSVLVCDVRDFTSFAARASAKEVVSRLNELFEVIVPIVGRHGGHVDKFLGDGLPGRLRRARALPGPRRPRGARRLRDGEQGELARRPRAEDRGGGEHRARWSPGRSAAAGGSTSA